MAQVKNGSIFTQAVKVIIVILQPYLNVGVYFSVIHSLHKRVIRIEFQSVFSFENIKLYFFFLKKKNN